MNDTPKKLSASLMTTIFGLIFGGMGLFFSAMIGADAIADLDLLFRWEPQICEIISAKIERTGRGENPYEPRVDYQYSHSGKQYRGETLYPHRKFNSKGFASFDRANRQINQFTAGKKVSCWINPREPAESSLTKRQPWYLLFIPLPLIFTIIGIFLIIGAWLPEKWFPGKKNSTPRALSINASNSPSKPLVRRASYALGALIFGVFLCIGYFLGNNFYFEPKKLQEQSRYWKPTTCEVISSEVITIENDDSTSYRPDVLYSYKQEVTVRGDNEERSDTEYRSSRYNFLNNDVGGSRLRSQEVVNSLPAGTEFTCYFDPNNPKESVINRETKIPPINWILPLAFSLVGAVGLVSLLKTAIFLPPDKNTIPMNKDYYSLNHLNPEENFNEGQITLGHSRGKRFAGFAIAFAFAIFWNVIVGVAAYSIMSSFKSWWSLAIIVFILPFIGIGLFLIRILVPTFREIFAPLVELKIKTAKLTPGGEIVLDWNISTGPPIKSLKITLEGKEVATYTRGTDSVTDDRTFSVIPLVDQQQVTNRQGHSRVSLPKEIIPTFIAPHNKILWQVKFLISVQNFSDLYEEHDLNIRVK